MKKKIGKIILLVAFILLVLLACINIYKWSVCGKQNILFSTSKYAFSNGDLYFSIVAKDDNVDLEAKTKVKLLDPKGRKVKGAKVTYDGNSGTIKIPNVEPGNYTLKASVSSKVGKDVIKKVITIVEENMQNVTITLDKGIYKPGDMVRYRALLTSQENDEPIKEEMNICIYDGNDNKVYDEKIEASEYGIVSGGFKLADEVNSGIYKLVVKTNNKETTKMFKVNPYITPKYEVIINPDKQSYIVGDTANIGIEAKYFFGEPVSHATFTVYINNELYKEVIADENGIANIGYPLNTAKTYNLKIEAVDESNYFVETSKSIVAGTDKFEIELLPEYGELINGEKNDIYVITSTADGTPLKTYVTINSGIYAKQVITDENGIGKFSIDVLGNLQTFKIKAENEELGVIEKSISLKTSTKKILLKTDKIKYNQGEDIKIDISSATEKNRNIYVFKNKKLIKLITTDMDETTINLDDTYGLVDIYVTEYDMKYRLNDMFKKTIFIKPTKALNIEIETDKEEYKPGEEISISIGTTDENRYKVESALLVSMLDNSILNLANNDLSIDNIKLALNDIKFSDELDAATLYASILEESSDHTLTTLLLRQDSNYEMISENAVYNYSARMTAKARAIFFMVLIAIFVILFFIIKHKKFIIVVKHLLNILLFLGILMTTVAILIEEFGSWKLSNSMGWAMLITSIIGLAIYILWVYKLCKKTFRTTISIILSLMVFGGLSLLYTRVYIHMGIYLTVLAALILIVAILSKIKKIKNNKIVSILSKEAVYILKFGCAVASAYIVTLLIRKMIDNYYDTYGLTQIFFNIAVILTYVANYWINKIGKNKKGEEKAENSKKESAENIATIILATIGAIAVTYFVVVALFNMNPVRYESNSSSVIYKDDFEENYSKGSSYNNRFFDANDGEYDDTDKVLSNLKNDIKNVSVKDSTENYGAYDIIEDASLFLGKSDNTIQDANNSYQSVVEKTVDDNIRNVFLESMCFIPEIITKDGNAKIDLNLSDNITTWTIQTVGNTKDGRIGYNMLDNVKVFKDFFVDFEVPANLVEGDKISIPVTVYNYTDEPITTTLSIKEDTWFKVENNQITLTIDAKDSTMKYVPIEILAKGNNKLRIEAKNDSLTDIIEKEVGVTPNGYKIEKVVSAGSLDEDIEEDLLILDPIIENTASAKIKVYSSNISQTVDGMENIFRMPTGCFEQVSSSLYPNILALRYLENNSITNEAIRTKALSYISSGYQKLLTYEVPGESGGFSLYGNPKAETVLTAYGLMELTDLKDVYKIDENVTKRMTAFLYKNQNQNGSFNITGDHLGGAATSENLALNAYIIWALSESDANNESLTKSVEYLKGKIDKVNDNYTLALIANVLANVNDKEVNNVIKRLVSNVNANGKTAVITSNTIDYYGSRYDYQTLQTVALTSMALSKTSLNSKINTQLINYLICKKDTYGTWYSTQATVLALKALNDYSDKGMLSNQTIKVSINSENQELEIKDNPLAVYELTFNNLEKENRVNIDIEKGNGYYEIIEEYYIPYDKVDTSNNSIDLQIIANQELNVNDILTANIRVTNKDKNKICNGMVVISIPQGCQVMEESLALLETRGKIEKYEMNYRTVNLYIRDFDTRQKLDLTIYFRARYPVDVTGLSVRAYDYYNPNVEGFSMPIGISVTQ